MCLKGCWYRLIMLIPLVSIPQPTWLRFEEAQNALYIPSPPEYPCSRGPGLCRPRVGTALGALTRGLPSGPGRWTPTGSMQGVGVGDGGADCLSLSQAPRVCEQELTLVGRRQPCVRAFSRTVPVWRAGLWAAGLVCQP